METKDLILNGKTVSVSDIAELAKYLAPHEDQGQNSGDSTNPHRGICLYPRWGYGAEEMAEMIATLLSKYDVNSDVIKSSLPGSCVVRMNIEKPEHSTQYYSLVQRIKSAIIHVHGAKRK